MPLFVNPLGVGSEEQGGEGGEGSTGEGTVTCNNKRRCEKEALEDASVKVGKKGKGSQPFW
jgi:hypothetical protein